MAGCYCIRRNMLGEGFYFGTKGSSKGAAVWREHSLSKRHQCRRVTGLFSHRSLPASNGGPRAWHAADPAANGCPRPPAQVPRRRPHGGRAISTVCFFPKKSFLLFHRQRGAQPAGPPTRWPLFASRIQTSLFLLSHHPCGCFFRVRGSVAGAVLLVYDSPNSSIIH